jgi:hypothetical protein
LSINCQAVAPSQQNLNFWQKTGLELVALFEGRDVVLAMDLTESVGLNDEGRIRLRQIIEDSLQKGDSVYVVPFASTVNPLAPKINPITLETAIPFTGKPEDIDRILKTVPLQANVTQQRTDIQLAESLIYRELAQVNQCRLVQPQSVVWLTDAPLFTQPGITSKQWVETPAKSPFRVQTSPQSQERKNWLEALPLQQRSRSIDNYQLTVVDLAPTVQEFCTPAPGGKETCLVTPYLIQQLWLPAFILLFSLIGVSVTGGLGIKYLMSLKKNWQLRVICEDSQEEQIRFLSNQQSLAIGDDIECPGAEVRGYLKRDRNQLYLEPVSQELPIYYQGREITNRQPLKGNYIRLNCPYKSRDFELTIQVKY